VPWEVRRGFSQRLIRKAPIDDLLSRRPSVTELKRLVLDVLKPHKPSLVELTQRLSALKGIDGVNCSLDEVDQETETVKVTIEGTSIAYDSVEAILRELGAVIHSVDEVAAGKRLVEDVRTLQDHRD
jgi:hypothetical protein